MEKRLYIKKCLAVIACTFAMINGANAFLLPPMPWSISFDGVADVSGGVEGGGNVAVSGMEKAQQKVTDVLDKIKKTKADIESKIDDVIYLNPGSLGRPRDFKVGTFAVMTPTVITIFDVNFKVIDEMIL